MAYMPVSLIAGRRPGGEASNSRSSADGPATERVAIVRWSAVIVTGSLSRWTEEVCAARSAIGGPRRPSFVTGHMQFTVPFVVPPTVVPLYMQVCRRFSSCCRA